MYRLLTLTRSFRRIVLLATICIAFIVLVLVASPIIIIPPINPVQPVPVFVTEYGWHSRLVLPTSRDILIQYAYGDWKYYALNQQNWRNTIAALIKPTPAALGRRTFSNFSDFQQSTAQTNATILSFQVSKAKVSQLLESLNNRFNRQISSEVNNNLTKLNLVKDDQDYTLVHNSNHELVLWLRKLDCKVKGLVIWANFRVKTPS
ncbi:conserved hypothetical protein [Gloeothece citriformis PCC 7424]|uniref:DUF2459 domain-containing protein n=1 Tax=Gloeothece citriformis (strain PCC 7424) TaxID=65393 RepID=B7KKH3_GLOC7|nr:hypothetical protein [Gloeothece citriformis]ACK72306.1 conserved hypothetical protein [Gloeothece citriformis PCC 7424]